MNLCNKSKRNMYFVLSAFNKYNDMLKTQNYICNKLKITEDKFAQIISECVAHNFFDGIESSASINNRKHITYCEHVYITYSGYEFLKNYYEFIKNLLWNLFLIIATAIITVMINNKFSDSNQNTCVANQITSQNCSCIKICNNTND